MVALPRKDVVNLGALACIQLSNALLPLLIYPFALSVLGAARFSDIVIAETIAIVVLAVVLFSFDIDGISRVAGLSPEAHSDEIALVFSTIMTVRLILFALAAAVGVGAFTMISNGSIELILLWLMVPLGHILQSAWLFQGLERNVPAAVIIVISRIACVAVVVTVLVGPSDAPIVPAAIGGSFLISGLGCALYARLAFALRWRWAPLADMRTMIVHGKEIFLGNFAVLLYRDLNVLVLQLAGAAPAAIASYALVEKFVKMLQASTRPLSQVFFPKLLRRIRGVTRPDRTLIAVVARYTVPQLGALLVLLTGLTGVALAVSSYSPAIATHALSAPFWALGPIMVPALFFGIANFMFGVAGLNYLGERRYLFGAILVTGIVNLAACYALGSMLGATGAAICFTLSEAVLTLLILRRYLSTRPPEAAVLPQSPGLPG